MIRLAAFAAALAVLVAASFGWADEGPPDRPTADAGLGKGSVTSLGIRDGTVRLRDLHRQVRQLVRRPQARRGRDGEDGFDGLGGFDGLDGFDGQDGVSGREVVNTASQPSENAVITAQADCPGTKQVVGGGAIPPTNAGASFKCR
jgi:hypothetical protein